MTDPEFFDYWESYLDRLSESIGVQNYKRTQRLKNQNNRTIWSTGGILTTDKTNELMEWLDDLYEKDRQKRLNK